MNDGAEKQKTDLAIVLSSQATDRATQGPCCEF